LRVSVDASAVLSNLSGPTHTNRCHHKFAFAHVKKNEQDKSYAQKRWEPKVSNVQRHHNKMRG
jgi:hypothetical protein